MLNIDIDVVRGITFVRVEGDLNNKTFDEFDLKINNLIYKFGMQFFVFNFVDVIDIENNIFNVSECNWIFISVLHSSNSHLMFDIRLSHF